MDSEDEVFLAKTNRNRRADGLRTLTDDHFETIIDRLEKETFKHVSKQSIREFGSAILIFCK